MDSQLVVVLTDTAIIYGLRSYITWFTIDYSGINESEFLSLQSFKL